MLRSGEGKWQKRGLLEKEKERKSPGKCNEKSGQIRVECSTMPGI
jgi:hypothetical protein